MKKLFTTILALLLAFGTFTLPSIETDLTLSDFTITASAEAYEGFKYSILDDGTVEITGYTGSDSKLAIPGTIDGKKVTSIGNYVFNYYGILTSITIPNSVTSIGHDAFYGTPWLKARQNENPLVIVNDILIDGSTAFGKVVIPNTVNKIADSAFIGIYSDASNQYESSITSITIPNSVTSIGNSAFWNCTSLKSITIPDSVTSIGEYAFDYCTSLTDVYYTGSVAEWNKINIDRYNSCLTDATIHYNYVTVKTYRDFEYSILDDGTVKITDYTGSDSKLVIPSTIDGKKVTSIGGYAFEYCTSLTSITIPNSVTSIWNSAFNTCTSLTSITIPNSVTRIGNYAFKGTPWLKAQQEKNPLVIVDV